MKKLLLWLVILAAVLVLAVKCVIYYRVTAKMDELAASAKSYAYITYGSVSSSLGGQVFIRDVRMRIYDPGIYLTLEEVEVTFPDLKSLLMFDDSIFNDETPEHINIAVKHLRLPVEELKPYISELHERRAQQELKPMVVGCGALEQYDVAGLLQLLGYNQMDFSFDFGYRWHPLQKRLTVTSEFVWHEMSRSSVSIDVSDVVSFSGRALPGSKLREIAVEVADQGYNGRFIRYCAEMDQISEEAFIGAHLGALHNALREQGVTLGDSLYRVYEYYLRAQGPITFAIYPDSMERLANLQLYKPADIPRLLNMEIRMGDQVIRDIDWDWDQQKMKDTIAAYQKPAPPPPPEVVEPAPSAEPEQPAAYRILTVNQLPQYLQRQVVVEADNGRRFSGKLVEVNDAGILLEVSRGSGYARLPLDNTDIKSVKMLQ